jgi:hypothetical protein
LMTDCMKEMVAALVREEMSEGCLLMMMMMIVIGW